MCIKSIAALKHLCPQRIPQQAVVIQTGDTGNTARIIPNCQTQEHVQHPLLPLFSNSYSQCCKGRGSLSSLFVWASVFSEGFSLSIVLDKPDCNKLTKEPSESMHSDNIALHTCMKSFWKLNSKISGFFSNIQVFP